MPHYLSIYLILSHSPLSSRKGGWDGICTKCPCLIYLCTCAQTNWSCHMTFLIFFFEFIPYFIRPEAPGFHVDSMWIPHRMHGRVKAAPFPHILHGFTWNPCGIHAESMESLWTPGSPVLRNFCAFHGICMESAWIPHGFLVHFWQGTLPFFYPLECLESTQNPWKFHTDSTDSVRNEWGRVKSSYP